MERQVPERDGFERPWLHSSVPQPSDGIYLVIREHVTERVSGGPLFRVQLRHRLLQFSIPLSGSRRSLVDQLVLIENEMPHVGTNGHPHALKPAGESEEVEGDERLAALGVFPDPLQANNLTGTLKLPFIHERRLG